MEKLFSISLLILFSAWNSVVLVEGIFCWVCENQPSNEACELNGRVQRCQKNQEACQNEVRRGPDGILVTKRCKQSHACDNNYIQNPRASWSPSQCNGKVPSSVCRCCCFEDMCNSLTLDCVHVQALSDCNAIKAPRFGKIQCDGNGRELGSTCSFACDDGFEMLGDKTSTCTMNDATHTAGFNRPIPTCKRMICKPAQRRPTNGFVRCVDRNNVGSACIFTCDEGYLLQGSPVVTCGDDMQWDLVAPTCIQVRCPPPQSNPANGQVSCTNANALGSDCSFSCLPGYRLLGSPTTTCWNDFDNDAEGVWSEPAPVCVGVTCSPPHTDPVEGTVECSDANNAGSTCSFSCNRGFVLSGPSSSLCQHDSTNEALGLWSQPPPTCVPITCIPLQSSPTNGDVHCTDANNEGSQCSFACAEGYYLAGSPSTTCEDDLDNDALGVWSQPAPNCVRITCEPPHTNPINGVFECTDANNEKSICSFSCNVGYFMNGSPTSVCNDDKNDNAFGLWSDPAPTCVRVTCDILDSPTNGLVECSNENNEQSVCRFTCEDGYYLDGSLSTVCEDDLDDDAQGLWSQPSPVCKRITCPPPHVAPIDGTMLCTDENNEGSECRFVCNVGFFLDGSAISMCVDDVDNDAEEIWSHPAPTCVRIACIPLSNPINGEVVCSDDNFEGSECRFTCDRNFALTGSPESVCVANGDNPFGEWSNLPATCESQQCGDAPSPGENGLISCDDNILGSVCEYECDPYYTLVGPLLTTCVEGKEGLIWDNPAPICQINRCPEQELPRGQVTCDGDSTSANTSCSFECLEEGYELFPPNITNNFCLRDTTWSVPKPCCSKPCPPNAVMDFVIVMDSSSSIGRKNWLIMKAFVRSIFGAYVVSPDAARLSVFRYNRRVDERTQIFFNDFTTNQESFLRAFDAIPYDGFGTFTGLALEHARDVIFTRENGDREGIRDVMLVITDGRAQDDVTEVSKDLREHGVLTFALGVVPPRGELDHDQLLDIAGAPEHIFIAEGGFEGLTDAFSLQLSAQICGDPCHEDPHI